MTEKDRQLIARAEQLPYTQWYIADDLAEQADTPEARQRLRDIAKYLNHREEYHAGSL